MEKCFDDFQKWFQENTKNSSEQIIDEAVVGNIYKKAKEKLDKIMPFEEAMVSLVYFK